MPEAPASRPAQHVALLTGGALLGFAANSVLCRLALATHAIHPASFTAIRLASGALTLTLLAVASAPRGARGLAGSASGALLLFVYAAAFSLAYVRLAAGTGALLLFGSVQVTLLAAGIARGERPRAAEWTGLALAASGLGVLTWPQASVAAGVLHQALMMLAGIAWAGYTLRGRREPRPLAATAGNFLRSVPLALALAVVAARGADVSARGVALAALSGSVTSGIAYSLWYAALPGLTRTRAALVQLAVPVLAAAGGVTLLGEHLTARLVTASTLVLGGVTIALVRRQRTAR